MVQFHQSYSYEDFIRGFKPDIEGNFKLKDGIFYVPKNLFIIGTMNTADRSLSLVDYALRRRFSFIDVKPAFNTEEFNNYLSANGVSDELISKINYSIKILNDEIEKDDVELGKGYKIGHSYFCNIRSNNDEESWNNWYSRIIKFEIKPLLEEYWFDNKEKVSDLLEQIK